MNGTVLTRKHEILAKELDQPDYIKWLGEAKDNTARYRLLGLIYRKRPLDWKSLFEMTAEEIARHCETQQEFSSLLHALCGLDDIKQKVLEAHAHRFS